MSIRMGEPRVSKLVGVFVILIFLSRSVHSQEMVWKGLGHPTDVAKLRAIFPNSVHEFSDLKTGRIFHPGDSEVDFDFLLKSGSGQYLIRLTADESFDHVYFIQAKIENGERRYLQLSFELPSEFLKQQPPTWEADHRARHPKCDSPRSELVKRYGRPEKATTRGVERLFERIETWQTNEGPIELTCYQLDGKGEWLGQDVKFLAKGGITNR
jgi:hypothetical protein